MTENLTHILIFKTNISTPSDKLRVMDLFASDKHIEDCSVDTEDVDCVLRVVSPERSAGDIINMVRTLGFNCTELE